MKLGIGYWVLGIGFGFVLSSGKIGFLVSGFWLIDDESGFAAKMFFLVIKMLASMTGLMHLNWFNDF